MKSTRSRAALIASACLASALAASPAHADSCSAMASAKLGADVKITSARHIAAGPAQAERGAPPMARPAMLPAHCIIEGVIAPRTGAGGKSFGIGFAIALPDQWAGRFLLQGGGGLNGTVRPPLGAQAAGPIPALARGFAVISHDSGHKGAVFDFSFMADQRAALDFALASVKTVGELGKAITARYYRRPIAHSYMAGCSTGGRETMEAMQRFPEMFDGLVVGAPAMRTGNSNLALAHAAVAFNQAAPRDAQGLPDVGRIFSAADRKTILTGLLDQCDGLDGLRDGMIANPAACHFRAAALQCAAGQSTNCLSPLQTEALERAFQPPRDKAGHALYSPFLYDTGNVDDTAMLPGFLPTGKGGILGPVNRALAFDADAAIEGVRADPVIGLTDTDRWVNLSTFLGHQGKVLFYHGVSDPWFSALDTWDYYTRASAANGAAFTDSSRFYMVPGMSHCGGGNAYDSFDLLGAVVDWVEKGLAPAAVTASRRDSATMPLCPYPAYAAYTGGDAKRAESFACRPQ